MFSGQGSQYVNMGLDLYKSEPTFRDQIDQCAEILLPHLSFDLRDILYPGEKNLEQAEQTLTQTFVTQPALFVIEYALAKLWMSWGVTPAALVGHSIGEYVAACLAGVFSLKDALTLVAERGRLMQQLPGGSMLVVPLSEKEVQPFLGKKLSLAVINGPSLCVVSGEKEPVEDLKGQLAAKKIACRYLQTSHAFHSEMMEPILQAFAEKVKQVAPKPPEIPFVSNVTGTWIKPEEATDPGYWARHLRRTVRFSDCLQVLLKEPNRVFLEVGPGHTFTVLINQQPGKTKDHIVLSSIRHIKDTKSDLAFILNSLGQIWLAGPQIDWPGFNGNESRHRLPLPTYPFERKRYWIEAGKQTSAVHFNALILSEESDKALCSEIMHIEENKIEANNVASRGDIEQIIINIWQELLGIDQVRVHDNFFELGGNSLTALRMISRIEDVFGIKLPLSIFKSPTVEQLVIFIFEKD